MSITSQLKQSFYQEVLFQEPKLTKGLRFGGLLVNWLLILILHQLKPTVGYQKLFPETHKWNWGEERRPA